MNWIAQHPVFCSLAFLWLIVLIWGTYRSMKGAQTFSDEADVFYTDETHFD